MEGNVWLLTWTTYGTWLPGDARGFVGYILDPAIAQLKNPLTRVNGSKTIHDPTTLEPEPTTPVVGCATEKPADSRPRLEDVSPADDASRRVSTHRVIHNVPGTPYDRDIPALQLYARELMKGDPVWLTHDQAETFLAEARRTAEFRRWALHAAAVMANHVHLVVGVPENLAGERLLQEFKSYGSRVLNQRFGKPKSGTWWTKSGSTRLLPTERAVTAAIEYVRNQQRPLVVWIASEPTTPVVGSDKQHPATRVDFDNNTSTGVDDVQNPSTGVDGSKMSCEPKTPDPEPRTPVVGSDTNTPKQPSRTKKDGGV